MEGDAGVFPTCAGSGGNDISGDVPPETGAVPASAGTEASLADSPWLAAGSSEITGTLSSTVLPVKV